MSPLNKFATLTGVAVTLLSYIFLRWIPSPPIAPIVYALLAAQATLHTVFAREKGSDGSGPSSAVIKKWSTYHLYGNILLVLGVVDLVYRPLLYNSQSLAFSRIGYVSADSAKILIREPDIARLPLQVFFREVGQYHSDWAAAGTIQKLSNETDYTQSIIIKRLQPSTVYQYAASNNLTGSFKTAPALGTVHPSNGKFTFLTSSCIKPRYPYHPFSHPRAIPGLRDLAKWIPQLHASFMLFLGDFIYIDVPLARDLPDIETYRHEYRQVYSSPDWAPAANTLPWIHVIDDHEIINDWDQGLSPPYPSAIDPWNIYHAAVNPPAVHPNASYFQFTQGPASFFMLDTRRYRSPSNALPSDSPDKTMLGQRQLTDLLAFLARDEPRGVHWKFVVSSIPFTRNWRINSADTWAGYLHERQIIIEAMWDVNVRFDGIGVVVLSGDRHEFAATSFPPPRGSKWPVSATVTEFSTSPLSMFYLPIRTYWETAPDPDPDKGAQQEPCIKYLPDGNSKFGAIELETVKGGEQGLLKFRLFVDGSEVWQHVLTTPASAKGSRGLEALWS